MRVLLTGATGYVGSAVLEALVAGGHEVLGLVRDPDRAGAVRERGASPVIGDITDAARVRELAAGADGVVHLASPGDATSAEAEDAFVTAVLAGLGGTGKPLVSTAGIWDHGSGGELTEVSPFRAPRITAWRPEVTRRVLAATGVRTAVISPALVYGRGGGLLRVITGGPRRGVGSQALTVLGSGEQHWATVHVDDLAALYVLALEKARAGTYLIGASGVNPTVREITVAASRAAGLDGRVEPEGLAGTVERLGLLGEALLLDQRASGTAARQLGWQPTRPTLLEHLTGR
ncbi:NAD-dependent epimerase/dehydratase family protein [Saccharothrix coeruleofusca]|uniref:NAD-dependent epimerase/dehydratase domain-containing protein n=1 Tax=Saccharothrix coeruleofusca TaxID=33919 RepID=A0A918EE66_9PSEU|nr:NAD-dependent epimerase/dehydratase family protein [Saccharothrix coeruleofusca]GGP55063.1 hypothetical protein GCM10010185_29490 [Saccharothrix coeruleofusca]